MGRLVYIKYHGKDGKSYIRWHQTWDADRFIESVRAEQFKQGIIITPITQEEYYASIRKH